MGIRNDPSPAFAEPPSNTLDPVDRIGWRPGPWDAEPSDGAMWTDPATGYACAVVRNDFGAWCGYVGVPAGHPWHRADYDALEVTVHGGLTYGQSARPSRAAFGRVVDGLFWLGFDCAHWNDLSPGMPTTWREGDRAPPPVYRTEAFARAEVTALAAQAAAAVEASK